MSNFEIGEHNPKPLPELDYTRYCEYCMLMGQPVYNMEYEQWQHMYDISMTEQRGMPCKADRLRKAYVDYRMKFISAPTITIPADYPS